MFEVVVLAKLLNLQGGGIKQNVAIMCGSFVCGYGMYAFYDIKLFGLDKAVLALGLYVFGVVMGKIGKRLTASIKNAISLAMIPIWILSGAVFNTKVSMYGFDLGNYWFLFCRE